MPPTEVGGDWTTDHLLGGRLVLRQPSRGYRVAVDTVLLAAAVPARPGARVVELGAGVGGAALAVATRVPGVGVVAVEREPALARALAANAVANGLHHRVHAVVADVAALPLRAGGAEVVFTNPPYAAGGSAPLTALGRAARREGELDLGGWLRAAVALVRPGGDLVVVHRADRLGEILAALAPRSAWVLPLWPRAGVAAKRVLVRARVGRRGGVRLGAGLVLHDHEGHFTAQAEAVLRHAAELTWE
ncbi:MAG: methyltransferase [Alphaproteobacteria bacterium]|jgi:tRNA1(Val) A37 N6-methylase TrmN6|nr:methyltransferase [Alphaproteobacteria bacterium]